MKSYKRSLFETQNTYIYTRQALKSYKGHCLKHRIHTRQAVKSYKRSLFETQNTYIHTRQAVKSYKRPLFETQNTYIYTRQATYLKDPVSTFT